MVSEDKKNDIIKDMKTGIIDVGGGMRGIYGAGVLDYCLDENIIFDHMIGISAGAANMSSYMASQRGRNYRFYTDYSFRREYMGWNNYIRSGGYINLDYIYSELSNEGMEDPLDYRAIEKEIEKGRHYMAIATDAATGEPVYFTEDDMEQDDYGIIKASCCVPLVNKPYEYKGKKYFDGGLSDPVPVEKAFELGCDLVVLVLTKPRDYYRETQDDAAWAELLGMTYPEIARKLALRGDIYNFYLDKAKDYEKEGRVLIVAPDDIGSMKTLTRKKEDMDMLYNKGLEDAKAIKEFLSRG